MSAIPVIESSETVGSASHADEMTDEPDEMLRPATTAAERQEAQEAQVRQLRHDRCFEQLFCTISHGFLSLCHPHAPCGILYVVPVLIRC